MSTRFTCDDKQSLIAFVYGEIDAEARARIESHLATCEDCAFEVAALGDVRSGLGLWAPPDAELGFTIVRQPEQMPANVLRPSRWWPTVPAWAQAAAALLVVAAGLSIANLQIRSGPDGVVVTTGWLTPAPAPAERFDGAAVEQRVEQALASLEQQLRGEIRAAREQVTTPVRAAAPSAPDEATIRRVQQLLAESEQRHERELALRFTQFTRDLEVQRRADLARIGYSMSEFGTQMNRQRQMLNNVIRVSSVPQQ
jgi:anti-sigma factor RsiW